MPLVCKTEQATTCLALGGVMRFVVATISHCLANLVHFVISDRERATQGHLLRPQVGFRHWCLAYVAHRAILGQLAGITYCPQLLRNLFIYRLSFSILLFRIRPNFVFHGLYFILTIAHYLNTMSLSLLFIVCTDLIQPNSSYWTKSCLNTFTLLSTATIQAM